MSWFKFKKSSTEKQTNIQDEKRRNQIRETLRLLEAEIKVLERSS